MNNTFRAWILASRLQTLPLSISGILLGSSLAYFYAAFDVTIFILCIILSVGFQILSNFTNDYGDGIKGTDKGRIGPKRVIESGLISISSMKKAIRIIIGFNLIIIFILLYISFGIEQIAYLSLFLILGVFSISAAMYYTLGNKPYGYRGLGDLAVFLFFGLLSVCGSYFLYTKTLHALVFLPACSLGLLCVAILNLNNIRDIENDKIKNKRTLAVILGLENAKLYHYNIIVLAMILLMVFSFLSFKIYWENLIYFVGFIPLIQHLFVVKNNKDSRKLNSELKKVAVTTFFITLLFSFGILL